MVYIPEFNQGRSSVAVQQQSPSIESAKRRIASRQNQIPSGARVFIPEFAPARTSQAVQEQIIPAMRPERTTTPVQTAPAPVQVTPDSVAAAPAPAPALAPVQTTPEPTPATPESAPATPEPTPYNVYDDPMYQEALQQAQGQFNLEMIDAAARRDYEKIGLEGELAARPGVSEAARRRLAGNFARRGMGMGRYGALFRAEEEAKAREDALRVNLNTQMQELDRQYTSQFGAPGTDWLGTLRGSQAQQNAIQQALQNRLAGLTTVG